MIPMEELEYECPDIELTPTYIPFNEHTQDAANYAVYAVNSVLDADVFNADQLDRISMFRIGAGVFYDGAKSKFSFLNDDNQLVRFPKADALRFLKLQYGNIVAKDWLTDETMAKLEQAANAQDTDTNTIIQKIQNKALGAVMDYLQLNVQVDTVEHDVDMFAKHASIAVKPRSMGTVTLTHGHVAPQAGSYRQAIIDDYKQQFPQLDCFIGLLAASCFAGSRKKAYLWVHAPSDWGKGFLINCMDKHGLVTETSVKEIEAMLEGKPVGKSAGSFIYSRALLVDEFKNVKSELKQLESKISLAPKHQLSQTVPVYLKVFTSADGVDSLVGEMGVEKQFANRFSCYTGFPEIRLQDRPVFKEHGDYAYLESVSNYMASEFNKLVEQYRTMTPQKASGAATSYIDSHHEKYGIKLQGSFEGNFEGILTEFSDWCVEHYENATQDDYRGRMPSLVGNNVFYKEKSKDGLEGYWITKASKLFEVWVNESFTVSERAKVSKARTKILDGLYDHGSMPIRLNGKSRKAKKLTPTE